MSSTDTRTIGYDLRPAFLDAALSRTPMVTSPTDLRILARLVYGGTVRNEPDIASSLGAGALVGWPRQEALATALTQRAFELDLLPVVELEHELLPIVAQMSARGLGVNAEAWGHLRVTRLHDLAAARKQVGNLLGPRAAQGGTALRDALRARGFAATGAGKAALAAYRGKPEIEAAITFNALLAFASNACPSMEVALREHADGRVRADIDPLGTTTGRFTTSKPNVLGLEKAAQVRRCVVPTRRHILISTDVKAAELRILAALTGEEQLIEGFRRGIDPHRLTAGRLFGVQPEDVDARQRNLGKITNFAMVFGGGADVIRQQSLEARLIVSADDAARFFESFCEAYPAIAGWLDTSGQDLSMARSALGRMRLFEERNVPAWLNAPVQMTGADAIKFAMIEAAPQLAEIGAHILLCVHDELLVEAPVSVADRAAMIVRTAMVRQFEETLGNIVPFAVDQFSGPTWAESDATWVWPPTSTGGERDA